MTRVGVVVTTVGRWEALERLLDSVGAAPVAVANQSGGPVPAALRRPGVRWVESTRGISRGRNDAFAALAGDVDVVGFPNDHSWYEAGWDRTVAGRWEAEGRPGALAGSLAEPGGVRMMLPPAGTPLTRWTVWRAIEPALFVHASLVGRFGFREDLGIGSAGPWQAGEGTELLLRIMAAGRPVVSAPDLCVHGDGERRSLDPEEWRAKLRGYGRGIGRVLRLHQAGPVETAAQVLLPWYRWVRRPPSGARTPPGDCLQASLGRLEGRMGRCLPLAGGRSEREGPDRATLLK